MDNTLSRNDLAHALCDAHDTLNLDEAQALLGLLFRDILPTALRRGRTVKLQGFGTFCAPVRASRTFRNPKTHEPVDCAPKRAIRFRASRALKGYVAGERS